MAIEMGLKIGKSGMPGWLSRLTIRFWLGSWSQGPGIESHIGLPVQWGVCFSLCMLLPLLVLSLSMTNK